MDVRSQGRERPADGLRADLAVSPLGCLTFAHRCSDISYCFELPTWEELDLFTVELTRVFRQENRALVDVLCKLRRQSESSIRH